jgi:AraC-like DNA-binding protein
MNRVTTIFQGKALVVERFDHPEDCSHEDPKAELTEQTVVTFIERGAFEISEWGRNWDFKHGDVLVSAPDIKRSYRHFQSCPDDVCLSVSFTPDVIESALGRLPREIAEPKVRGGVTSTFAYRWMIEALCSSDPLGIESAAFHCAVVLGPHRWQRLERLSGAGTHTRKIRRACMAMNSCPEENHSLTSLSAEAGMSPFYFARVFSELAGEPPHRYLVRIRLRRAAELLRMGALVTEAALKSGFPDINHFSKTFHRRYGVPPSSYSS